MGMWDRVQRCVSLLKNPGFAKQNRKPRKSTAHHYSEVLETRAMMAADVAAVSLHGVNTPADEFDLEYTITGGTSDAFTIDLYLDDGTGPTPLDSLAGSVTAGTHHAYLGDLAAVSGVIADYRVYAIFDFGPTPTDTNPTNDEVDLTGFYEYDNVSYFHGTNGYDDIGILGSVGDYTVGGNEINTDELRVWLHGEGDQFENYPLVNCTVWGGDGDDSLIFGTNQYGGDGNDYMQGTPDGVVGIIDGGDGNDSIEVSGPGDQVYGGEGDDDIEIEVTTGDPAIVDGGEGNDEIITAGGSLGEIINSAGDDTFRISWDSLYSGDVVVDADSGDPGDIDKLVVEDQFGSTGHSYTFDGELSRDSEFVDQSGFEQWEVIGGHGNDTFNIDAMASGTSLSVSGGLGSTGDDTYNVGSGDLDALEGSITIDPGSTDFEDKINIDDTSDTSDNFYVLTASELKRDAGWGSAPTTVVFSLVPGQAALEEIKLSTPTSPSSSTAPILSKKAKVEVESPNAANTEIHTGGGNDEINVKTLVDDYDATIYSDGASDTGEDTVRVYELGADSEVSITTYGGQDQIGLGGYFSPWGVVSALLGVITIDAGPSGSDDTLTLDDALSTVAESYAYNSTTSVLYRNSVAVLSLAGTGIERLLFQLSSHDDTVDMSNLPIHVTVYGNDGADDITGTAYADLLFGGAGNDTFDNDPADAIVS